MNRTALKILVLLLSVSSLSHEVFSQESQLTIFQAEYYQIYGWDGTQWQPASQRQYCGYNIFWELNIIKIESGTPNYIAGYGSPQTSEGYQDGEKYGDFSFSGTWKSTNENCKVTVRLFKNGKLWYIYIDFGNKLIVYTGKTLAKV